MIARVWRGWTVPENADRYVALLQGKILPSFQRLDGYHGASVLRHDGADEVEFVVMTRFVSMDAVRGFAGEDVERAVIEPEARALLSRFDERARHYEMVVDTGESGRSGNSAV